MNRIVKPALAVILSCAAVLLQTLLRAQDPVRSVVNQSASAKGDATPDLEVADLEAALASIEADAGITDAVKSLLRSKYNQAIDSLEMASVFETKAANYRDALTTAAEEEANLRDQLKALPSAVSAAKVTAAKNIEDLQKEVSLRRAARDALKEELSTVTSELARFKARPVEISTRSTIVQRELSDIDEQLASPTLAEGRNVSRSGCGTHRLAGRTIAACERVGNVEAGAI